MEIRKTKIVTITAVVLAMSAIAIGIAWLSATLPGSRHQPGPPPEDDTYEYPHALQEADSHEQDVDDSDPEAYPENTNIEEQQIESAQTENPDSPYSTDDTTYDYPAHNDIAASDEYPTEEYLVPFTPIFTREPLPLHIIDQITGVTFHDTTPFDYSFLTYLTVTHVNFEGEDMLGHLIVADEIGDEVLEIFREIYESGFPIHSIRLIDYFDASDYESMAANNSHAFNFRTIAGTTVISRHGFGMAIDINPIQNPYYRNGTIWPAAGAPYLDRSYVRPGMIIRGDAVYNAFISRGWIWGGNWTSPRDYHHFERRH